MNTYNERKEPEMLNLNELNAIVSHIRNMEREIEDWSIEPIVDSCIARHNECVDILLEVTKFLETSFPHLVSTPNARNEWRKVLTNHGPSVMVNPYNCIRCYPGNGATAYWVDGTIGFHMDADGKVSHIGILDKVPDCAKFHKHVIIERWNRDSADVVGVTKNNIEEFRRNVDETYNKVKKVVELLPVFLEKISESVMARRNTMKRILNETKDESKGGRKTMTLKIEIVED